SMIDRIVVISEWRRGSSGNLVKKYSSNGVRFRSIKKNAQWFVTWSINLESRLNNYKYAGGWFNDFQLLALDDIKVE
ncbi:13268_t:CDS:1, partial [Racocetra persica]